MARAIKASAEWKPKARRMIRRNFVFRLDAGFGQAIGERGLDQGTYSRMVWASLTKGLSQQRQAQLSQCRSSFMASS